MIEIVKHGKKNTEFQLICPFCACEFKYSKSDLEEERLTSYIKCPDCGAVIDHNFYQREKISKSLWKKWEKM